MIDDVMKNISNDEDFVFILKNLCLNEEQIEINKYLIQEVYDERQLDVNSKLIPIIILGSDNLLYKSYVLSKKGLMQKYINNIKTQDVTKINFNIRMSNIDRGIERKTLFSLLKSITDNYKIIEKGLYIYGSAGRGKTFISQALANWFANKNCSVGFVNTLELISYFKRNFGNEKVENMINTLKNVEYLFIDDIGSENISEWFRDEIFLSILSSRMNNKMPTFYSSNYDLDRLLKIQTASNKKIYYSSEKAKRLIARIKATSRDIKLEGKNYRY